MIASTSYNFYITHTLELGDERVKVIMYARNMSGLRSRQKAAACFTRDRIRVPEYY